MSSWSLPWRYWNKNKGAENRQYFEKQFYAGNGAAQTGCTVFLLSSAHRICHKTKKALHGAKKILASVQGYLMIILFVSFPLTIGYACSLMYMHLH